MAGERSGNAWTGFNNQILSDSKGYATPANLDA